MTMRIQYMPDPAGGNGGGSPPPPAGGAPPSAAPPAGGAPPATEYKFTVPQGMTVEKPFLDEMTEFAKKSKYTPEQAQSLFDRELARVKADADKAKLPDKYDLKPPQGVTLEQSALDEIGASAKALGLSREQAQKFLEHKLSEDKERMEFQKTFLQEQQKSWKGEIAAHPTYGGKNLTATAERASRAIARFAPPPVQGQKSFQELLVSSTLGDHPQFLMLMANIGAAMEEGKIGSGPSAPGSKQELSTSEKLRAAYEKDYAAAPGAK